MPYVINTMSGGLVGPFPGMQEAQEYMAKIKEDCGVVYALITPKNTSQVEWIDLNQPDDKGFEALSEAVDQIMQKRGIEPYRNIFEIRNESIRYTLVNMIHDKFGKKKINLFRLKELVAEVFTGSEGVVEDENEVMREYIQKCFNYCTRLDAEVSKGENK